MSERDDGGPAFPGWSENHYTDAHPRGGMTLRDYFAAKVMQGIAGTARLGGMPGVDAEATEAARLMASAAYAIADAMLKARNA